MSQAKSADDCGCTGKNGGVCDHNRIKRPRYFHGMLLDEKDFVAEQQHHAAKRRLLNRMLYGWGVVCGLDLEWKPNQKWVRILPGFAFDCFGNEIWVSDPFDVDLARLVETSPGLAQEPCAERDESRGETYYVCLQYHETYSDPVPVYVSGGDCKDQTCEFSRVQEGFCVKVLPNCPAGPDCGLVASFCPGGCRDSGPGGEAAGCLDTDCDKLEGEEKRRCRLLNEFCSWSIPCPDCSDHDCNQHCVVIGKITVNEKGCLVQACANDCRRYVPSGRMVQHLLTSLWAGVDKWALYDGKPIPSAHELATNPIRALCWVLQRVVLNGEEGWKDLVPPFIRRPEGSMTGTRDGEACLGQRDPYTRGPDIAEQIPRMEQQIQEQEALIRAQEASLSTLRSELTAKLAKSTIDARLTTLEQRTGDLAQQVEGLAGGGPAPE